MPNRNNRFHFVNVLQTNKAMLILCMGIALLIWVLTKLSKTYTTTLDITTEFATPQAKTFRTPPPESVVVDIRAKGWQLLSRFLRNSSPIIRLKVQNNTVNVTSRQIRQAIAEVMPDEIEVLRFTPDNIPVALDHQEVKKIPITAIVENLASSRYQLSAPVRLIPDSITVAGPKTELSKLKSWNTDSLSSKQILLQSSGVITVAKHQNNKVSFWPNTIKYRSNIEELTEKSLIIPIKIRNCKDSVQLFPRTISLVCRVGLSHYDDLYENNFEIIADFKNIDLRQAVSVPLSITKSPTWVRLDGLHPNKADFLVVKK